MCVFVCMYVCVSVRNYYGVVHQFSRIVIKYKCVGYKSCRIFDSYSQIVVFVFSTAVSDWVMELANCIAVPRLTAKAAFSVQIVLKC